MDGQFVGAVGVVHKRLRRLRMVGAVLVDTLEDRQQDSVDLGNAMEARRRLCRWLQRDLLDEVLRRPVLVCLGGRVLREDRRRDLTERRRRFLLVPRAKLRAVAEGILGGRECDVGGSIRPGDGDRDGAA